MANTVSGLKIQEEKGFVNGANTGDEVFEVLSYVEGEMLEAPLSARPKERSVHFWGGV
ncbi:hypothetical protein D3C86_1078520 [compost metagenome]